MTSCAFMFLVCAGLPGGPAMQADGNNIEKQYNCYRVDPQHWLAHFFSVPVTVYGLQTMVNT